MNENYPLNSPFSRFSLDRADPSMATDFISQRDNSPTTCMSQPHRGAQALSQAQHLSPDPLQPDAELNLDEMLSLACRQGKQDIVEILLGSGANYRHRNKAGNTPLLEACSQGHVAIARVLLDRNAEIDMSTETTCDSPLTWACTLGKEEIVELLLQRKANVEHRTKDGCTALMFAALAGHVSVVSFLLSKGAQLNVESDSNKDSPLTFACWKGHVEVVALLLKNGADIEHRTKEGFTPLMFAALGGHTEVARLLLKHDAHVNVPSGSNNDIPLTSACWKGHPNVVELLLTYRSSIEHRTKDGCTPLMLASREGHLLVAKLLLERGAKVNQPSGSENNIPLTLACWKGHCDVVELLLHFNSELEHRNKAGCSPLMLASREGHFEATYLLLKHGAQLNEPSGGNDDTPLTLACWKGHERVVRLLLEYRSTIDHQTKTGCTPLMEATREGHDRVVKMLLENQADVETPDNYGQSPLFMACWKGHSDVANLLLCYGANRECRTKTGITPLFQACRENHVEVVRLLLLSGCSVNSPFPNSRECPLTLAAEKGFVELVDLLLSRDALVDCRTKKGSTPFFLACKDGHLEIAKALSESGAAVETSDHRNTTPLLASFRNGHCHVVDWLLKQVSHLPSDEECRKTLTPSSSNNDKELQSAKNRCMELIRKAKHAKERAAMHVAKILCDEVDAEKEKRLNKQKALARKKSKRKEKKKLKKEISSDLPPKSDPIPCSPSIHIPAPSEEHTYSTSAPEKLYPSHSISLLTSARPTTPPHFPIPPSQEYILAARRLSPPSPLPSDFPVAPVLLTAVSSVESLDTASDHAPVHDDRDSSFSDYEDSEVYLPGEHDAYYSNGSNYSDPLDAHSSLDPSTPLSMSTAPHAYSPSHSPLNSLSRITGDLTPPDSPVSSAILYLDPPSRGICPQQEATHPLSVRAQLPHSLKQPKLDSSYETADTHFRPRAPSLRSNPPSKHHKAARQDPWSPKNTPPAPWSKHYPSLPTDHTDSHPHTAVQVPPLSPATYSQVTSSTLSHRPSPPLYPLRPSPATHRDKLACNSPTPQTHSKYAPADSPLPDPGEKPPSRADSFPDTRGSEEEGEILRGTKNLQVSVSNSLVGRIIGKAGSRINQITNISGAHIHVSKPNSKSQERIITIKGTDRSLGIAKYLINEALSTPDKDIDFHQIAEGDRLNGREEEMFDSHKETTMDTSHLKSLTSSQSSLIPAPREVELECEQVPPVESTPNEVTRQQEVPDSCRPSSNPAPDTTPLSEPVLPSCSIETQKSYGAIGQEVCSRFGSTTSPPAPLSDPPLSDPPLNHQNSCPQHALFDPAFERGFGPIGAPPHPFNPSLPPVHPSRPFIKLHKRSEPPLNYIQNGILPHPHLHSSLSISPEPLSSPLPILTSSVWNFDPPSLSSNSNDLTWWSPVGINLNSNNQWNGSPLLNDRVHSKDTKDTASADADTNNHQTTDGESEEGSTNKPPRGRPSNGLTPEAVRKLFGTKDWASRSMNEGVPVSRILKELEKNCLPDCDAELEQLILLPEEEWKSLGIPIGRRVKLRALSQSVHKYLQTKHVNNNNNNNIRENEGGSQPTQERL